MTIKRIAILMTLMLALPGLAFAFEAGRDYQAYDEPRRTTSGGQVEVTEFFAYSCPACRNFNQPFHDWLEESGLDVNLVRVPIPLRAQDQAHPRAYFTARALGVVDDVHDDIYVALHDENRTLGSENAFRSFFTERGVDAEAFDEAWNSRAVRTQTQRAMGTARDYGIRSTPSVAVDGRYLVTGGQAGSQERMLAVIEHLAEQRIAERAE